MHNLDLTERSIRRDKMLFYILGPTIIIFYLYHFVFKFIQINKNKKRYIKLCDNYISITYPFHEMFKKAEERTVQINISDIDKISWSPLCNTIDVKEKSLIKKLFKYPIAHLVWFPRAMFFLLGNIIYFYRHEYDMRYVFKNIIIVSDEKDILIQIKNEAEYKKIYEYFKKQDIELDKLRFTLSPYGYSIKGN